MWEYYTPCVIFCQQRRLLENFRKRRVTLCVSKNWIVPVSARYRLPTILPRILQFFGKYTERPGARDNNTLLAPALFRGAAGRGARATQLGRLWSECGPV